MKFLIIDTSSSNSFFCFSNGVVEDNIVIYHNAGKDTSSKIIKGIDEVLSPSDVSELDRIFVVCGPGSFTGIRIGVSVALALGYAKNIEVIGLSAFNGFKRDCVKAIPSRVGYYYYSKDGIEGEIDENSLLQMENVQCFGENTLFIDLGEKEYASNLLSYARDVIDGKEKGLPSEPYYLKKCQAERMLDLKNGKRE